ncbi:MAG: hypothetical protein HQ559_00305 [Lentisphaerae bacterium]|nr:hypothetical protein [Lentisphaerota bacterium]
MMKSLHTSLFPALVLPIILLAVSDCGFEDTGFAGTWTMQFKETGHAYWVESVGDFTRILTLEETPEGTVSGRLEGVEADLRGQNEAGRTVLSGRSGDLEIALDVSVLGSTMTGTMRWSARGGYGGWWNWSASGVRELTSLLAMPPLP